MRYLFKLEQNEEYGFPGWRMKNQPEFDPLGGMAVAHDILEHFNSAQVRHRQSTEQEMLALGAAVYIRQEEGTYANMTGTRLAHDPSHHIGSMPIEIWSNRGHRAYTLPPPPKVRIPACIADARAEFHKQWRSEREDDIKHRDPDDPDPLKDIPPWDVCAAWLAKGYRMAKQRYRGLDPYQLCYLFVQIEKMADRACDNLADYRDYAEMELTVVPKRYMVKGRTRMSFEDHWESLPRP